MGDGQGFARVATRVLRAVVVVVLVGMSWAALHDIIAGERDITGEVTFLAFAALLLASVLMGAWMRSRGQTR